MTATPRTHTSNGQPFLLRWRKALASRNGPEHATTRHVLLTLSVWMDGQGGSCFPSTREIAEATGLSERAVCTHLERAAAGGWIRRKAAGREGRAWRHMTYTAAVPDVLNVVQHVREEGTERDSAPQGVRGTERHARGTEPNDNEALNEVQSNSPLELSSNSPKNRLRSPSARHRRSEAKSAKRTAEPAPHGAAIRTACEVWTECTGGTAPGARIGQAFKPLLRTHDPAEVLRVWRWYLTHEPAQFVNPQGFASKYGAWRRQSEGDATGPRRAGGYRDDTLNGPAFSPGSPLAHLMEDETP